MITDDYVSLELAKLLKKKGFDQNCAHYYLDGTMYRHHPTEVLPIGKETFAAPTLAQVMKWLREEKQIVIEIYLDGYYTKQNGELCLNCFGYKIWTFFKHLDEQGNENPLWDDRLFDNGELSSYNEATIEAIKYCLENLI